MQILPSGLSLLLLVQLLPGHGGQFRGPGDVNPPAPKTNSTSAGTGAPKSSGIPSSGAPAAGGNSTPAATGRTAGPVPVGATSAPRGVQLDDDLTRWEFWWEFGKDPYLRVREAVYGSTIVKGSDDALLNPHLRNRARDVTPPGEADLDRVAHTLAKTLASATDRDTVSACLVALAKIGRDPKDRRLFDVLTPSLRSHDQEIRETAALAIGIAGLADEDPLGLLIDLVNDGELARRISQQAAINERTRAFAAFGLGLLLHRSEQVAVAHRIIDALSGPLAAEAAISRDLRVAAIEAISLLPHERTGPAFEALRQGIVARLGDYYRRPLGPGDQLLQAHVPTAIARLLPRDHPLAAVWRERFRNDLEASLDGAARTATKTNVHVAQSCALALGELAGAWDDDTSDAAPDGRLLVRSYREHADHQTAAFSLLALARLGGQRSRAVLQEEFARGNRAHQQPWAAVALGVLAARERAAARATGAEPVELFTRPVREAFAQARHGGAIAAFAIGLGLAQDRGAADQVRAALQEHGHRDEVAGYLCIALGLLQDDRAIGPIRTLLEKSSRRPQVLLQCARALGLLGDRAVIDDLCAQLRESDSSLLRLSGIAAALGQIGDRRSLDPLLAMLADDRLTPLTRAFAGVALGGVCDKDPLPWNWVYATSTNYRAATDTLTDGAAGILDIL